MNRRPSDVPAPPPPSLRRPDLDPPYALWREPPYNPLDWPEPPPPRPLSREDDPGRGERFMRALMTMQAARRVLYEARVAAGEKDAAGG